MRLDQLAARTWNQRRSIEETSGAIHDGIAGDEALRSRGASIVRDLLIGNFPQSTPPKAGRVMEVGSGLGWIMQSMNDYLVELGRTPSSIVGLDIAENMIEQARSRLGSRDPYSFTLYDGLHIPHEDRSFDLIYSVAALQHIPRPFVFNLFFEILRLLKSDSFAVLHFVSTDHLPNQEAQYSWRREIDSQTANASANAHWHHYYTAKELTDVLTITGFKYVAIRDDGHGTLIVCASPLPLTLPNDFDSVKYIQNNSDLINTNVDGATHYLEFGHKEGRNWR